MRFPVLLLVFLTNQIYGQEFPEGFQFGVGTSAYQVEGAWNLSGKGENIWDWITHSKPNFIHDNSNGDVACDAYHKTKEDVQLLNNINVNFYRFSISWSRIFPTGHINYLNEDGLRYYNELIDELLANGITPLVTIYHWDLSTALHQLGGWTNPLMADYFVNFADRLFYHFGDKVQNWITFNEPYQICEFSYSDGILAPGYTQKGIAGYLCSHTVMIAHGNTYKLYQDKYKEDQGGRIGIVVHGPWFEPASDSNEDAEAAENILQFMLGLYVHPIYKGDYPPIVRERVDRISAEQGFHRSRLPKFTQEQIDRIRGSADFLGLNHYTSFLCVPRNNSIAEALPINSDAGATCFQDSKWPGSGSSWLKVVPWGFRKILNWTKEEYDNPEVIIAENGISDTSGDLQDCQRVDYFNSYLTEVLNAIDSDGCNIIGYTAWSFMDNFEWTSGYLSRFGIYHVDFEDDNRPRTPKMSAYVFKNIIDTRKIDINYTPEGFQPCGANSAFSSSLNMFLVMFTLVYLLSAQIDSFIEL